MYFLKHIATVLPVLLLSTAGVQAKCTEESIGTPGFNGGNCNPGKTLCGAGQTGGYSIRCCDNPGCN
ncbi:uncharacterized protein CTRU02_214695 [Colletotrichum truncatum]|uniref:Uncharacterized protein n=1 Tax=Colletotrichum truncatum TaxID=5467 RepID=A0ACC3YFI7_COLTU|nr:uncharacterized protein CTRU02_09639 [Colletotrichum truncatum]KAF6788321.1 hypothetical protein CTRU02_09639 [Colletotrichum truncatum]